MGTAQSKEEKGSILLSKMCCCVEYEPTPGSWADPSAALTMDDTHVTEAGMTMQYKQGEAPPTSQPVAPESTIQIQGTLKTNEEEEEEEEARRKATAAAAAAAREEAEEEEAARAALAARQEELEAVRREREGLERQLRAASADAERVEEARAWVLSVLGETFREGSTGDLEDGILLCKLVEAVRRGAPPAAAALPPPPPGPPGPGSPSSSPEHGAADRGFSVAFFLRQCRAVGVPEEDLFEEADLAEGGRGLPAVATCLLALRTIYDRRRLSSESGKTTVSSKKQSWEKSPASSPSAPPEGQEGGRAPAPALTPVAPEAAVEPTPRVGATPPPASPPAAAIEPTPPAEATIEAAVLPPQALAAERAPAPAEAAVPPSSPPPPVTPPPVTPLPAASPPAAATPGGGGGASGVPVRADGSANARRAANYYNPGDKVDDVRWWVETVTGQALPDPDFIANLKDGVVLCKLVNAIKPGTIKKINENTKVAFRLMENITNFGRACKALGVPEHDVFDTTDLWEEKEPRLVVKTIYALGRTIQVTVPEFNGPTLGPRLAQRNERTFSPEQLQESQRRAVLSGVTAGSWGTQGMASLRASTARPHQAGSVTFGAEHAGIGDSSVLSRFSMGSQQTMERPEASAGRNITPPPHAGLKKK